jgi:hypothetical protein
VCDISDSGRWEERKQQPAKHIQVSHGRDFGEKSQYGSKEEGKRKKEEGKDKTREGKH